MKGHIRQRGKNSWALVVDLGRDADGKRQQKWETYRGTKRDAQTRLREILSALDYSTYVEPNKLTFGEYLEGTWLKFIRGQDYARRTLLNYTHICRRHLIPALGHHPIQKLTGVHIETYYVDAGETGNLEGGGLSPKTILDHHRVLVRALNKAVKLRLIARNPCDDVDARKVRKYKARALDKQESGGLLRTADGTRVYGPMLLALSTGMRKGEILALRWKDIEKDKLTVNRILEQSTGYVGFKEPKTEGSQRTITLPEITVEMLRKLKVAQNKERLLMGAGYENGDLVFARPDGTVWKQTSFDGQFKRIARDAGFPVLRFHELRHTHATHLLQDGVNIKVVSERLGHASIRITLDLYAHVMPDMQEEAAKVADSAIRQALGK